MKASAGYLSPPHPDHIGQKALMEENRKEVCLVLLSPNRRQEQCLTREKKKKIEQCFPTKVSLLVERRDGDPVLEWQRADVRKSS